MKFVEPVKRLAAVKLIHVKGERRSIIERAKTPDRPLELDGNVGECRLAVARASSFS